MEKHRSRLDFEQAEEAAAGLRPDCRCCDAAGCRNEGLYRAPRGRDRLNEYFWFCLEHIREYNRKWDFCAGLSENEIEAMIRRDVIWQRPTWPMGSWRGREKELRERMRREFADGTARAGTAGAGTAGARAARGEAAGGGRERRRHNGAGEARTDRPAPLSPREEAMRVFNLEPPVAFTQIKARYRELVKLHHPDANGGDKASEERLKRINQAYNTLKACFGAT